MKAHYYIVGAFSDQRYQEAQVAVSPNSEDLNGRQMQDVARELNQQECVFVKTSYEGIAIRSKKVFRLQVRPVVRPPYISDTA